jgi:hypothetical protein
MYLSKLQRISLQGKLNPHISKTLDDLYRDDQRQVGDYLKLFSPYLHFEYRYTFALLILQKDIQAEELKYAVCISSADHA